MNWRAKAVASRNKTKVSRVYIELLSARCRKGTKNEQGQSSKAFEADQKEIV